MKNLYFSIINLLFLLNLQCQETKFFCPYVPAFTCCDGHCLPGNYFLVLEDNFTGNTLDTSKWGTYYKYGNNYNRCHGDEPQVYMDANVSFDNGLLLTFKEEPGFYSTCDDTTKWKQYTSGMIESKASFLYGIFEASIDIPAGTSFFPAFWLYGSHGEIDIFEYKDEYEYPEMTSRYWIDGNNDIKCTYNGDQDVDYSVGPHKYTMIWDPYYISWYIDDDWKYTHWLWLTMLGQTGIQCNNVEAYHEYMLSKSFPSHQDEENIIINLAAYANTNPSPLPQGLKVNYVRAWQRQDFVCADLILNALPNPIIKGKSIIVDGNIFINSNEQRSLIAKTKIVLKPGIEISSGAHFTAKINCNLCLENNDNLLKSVNQQNIDSSKDFLLSEKSQPSIYPDENNPIILYPNPVQDILHLHSKQKGILSICDINGNIIFKSLFHANSNDFDMSTFANGFYIVELVIDNKSYYKKIVKVN